MVHHLHDHVIWRDLVGNLLVRLLNEHGDQAEPSQLYEWFGQALDGQDHLIADPQALEQIAAWIEARPQIYKALFLNWMTVTPFKHPFLEFQCFYERLGNAKPPNDFAAWLLTLAPAQQDGRRGKLLVEEAVLVVRRRVGGLSLEALFAFADQHPRFRQILESTLSCPLMNGKWLRQ